MQPASHYVFPGAVLGSIIIALFGFSVTAGATLPMNLAETTLNLEESAVLIDVPVKDETDGPETIKAVGSEPGTDCRVDDNYPENIRKWCDLITKHAIKNNLDPDLVAALIWQESGGDPQAYSQSGAVGLMQVMPRDGIAASFMCPNGPCFVDRPTIKQLEDPKFNIKYGTKMLAGLQNKYGDMREVLKYYGPKDVGYYYADIVMGIYNKYKR